MVEPIQTLSILDWISRGNCYADEAKLVRFRPDWERVFRFTPGWRCIPGGQRVLL